MVRRWYEGRNGRRYDWGYVGQFNIHIYINACIVLFDGTRTQMEIAKVKKEPPIGGSFISCRCGIILNTRP